jgi:cytochrome c
MKARLLLALGATLIASGASAPAHASLELARQKACTSCHAVDKRVVGPAYADVARRYAGQKDAVQVLVQSIRQGGKGKWGVLMMPPQPALSEADARTLAAWILGGAK